MPSTTVETELIMCDHCDEMVVTVSEVYIDATRIEKWCNSCDEHTFECDHCDNQFSDEVVHEEVHESSRDRTWCTYCVDTDASTCSHCETLVSDDETSEVYVRGGTRTWCRDCRDDEAIWCDGCETYYHTDLASYSERHEQYYCNDCMPDDEDGVAERNHQERFLAKYVDEKGTILTSPRHFGVELEAENGCSGDVSLYDGWGIHSDGSLDNGAEFVSPPLRGKVGQQEIENMCNRITGSGFDIKGTCGYHTHISLPNFTDQQLRRILYGYIAFDDIFLAMQPASRRESRWCYPVSRLRGKFIDGDDASDFLHRGGAYITDSDVSSAIEYWKKTPEELLKEKEENMWTYEYNEQIKKTIDKYGKIPTIDLPAKELVRLPNAMSISRDTIEKWWYSSFQDKNTSTNPVVATKKYVAQRKTGGKYDSTRYAGLNLHVLFDSGSHYEVRYHTGTINAKKVLMWAEIHTTFADALCTKDKLSQQYFSRVLDMKLPDKVKAFQKLTGVSDDVLAYMQARIDKFKDSQVLEANDEE